MNGYLYLALVVALVGLVVAGRVLYLARTGGWYGVERRKLKDRRKTKMAVPIERRKGERRR